MVKVRLRCRLSQLCNVISVEMSMSCNKAAAHLQKEGLDKCIAAKNNETSCKDKARLNNPSLSESSREGSL